MKHTARVAHILVALVLSCCTAISVMAQGQVDAEQTFVSMLTNVTLEGTWAPVQQGRLGDEQGTCRVLQA